MNTMQQLAAFALLATGLIGVASAAPNDWAEGVGGHGALKIEQVWMNVYHGGTKPSPYDQHLYIDNVVIARKYIGPRR